MKKICLIGLLVFLGFVTVSCNKEKKSYTIKDIVGEYTFSNAADAFDGLEADEYTYLCYDAVITITSDGKNSVDFRLSCPNEEHSAILMARLSRMRTILLSGCRTITDMASTRLMRAR